MWIIIGLILGLVWLWIGWRGAALIRLHHARTYPLHWGVGDEVEARFSILLGPVGYFSALMVYSVDKRKPIIEEEPEVRSWFSRG